MPTHVAFLRAVNLGAVRKVPMAALREWLTEEGYAEVSTYLQTGNVRLVGSRRSAAAVERHLEQVLAERCGFEVPTIVRSPARLTALHAEALAAAREGGAAPQARRYLTLLKRHPVDPEAAGPIDAWEVPGERARVLGDAVVSWFEHPYHSVRLSNARLERALGPATTRDLKVVATLVERWGA